MCLNEIDDLLLERDLYDKELAITQARYNASLIQNDNAEKNYNEILKTEIIKNNEIDLQKKYKKYEMISKRLGLKFPNGVVK